MRREAASWVESAEVAVEAAWAEDAGEGGFFTVAASSPNQLCAKMPENLTPSGDLDEAYGARATRDDDADGEGDGAGGRAEDADAGAGAGAGAGAARERDGRGAGAAAKGDMREAPPSPEATNDMTIEATMDKTMSASEFWLPPPPIMNIIVQVAGSACAQSLASTRDAGMRCALLCTRRNAATGNRGKFGKSGSPKVPVGAHLLLPFLWHSRSLITRDSLCQRSASASASPCREKRHPNPPIPDMAAPSPAGATVLVRAKVIELNDHVHYSSMFSLQLEQTLFEQIECVRLWLCCRSHGILPSCRIFRFRVCVKL